MKLNYNKCMNDVDLLNKNDNVKTYKYLGIRVNHINKPEDDEKERIKNFIYERTNKISKTYLN